MKQSLSSRTAVLSRLESGARIQQRLDGCFILADTSEVVRTNTVYALENQGLINAGIITQAGRDALAQAKGKG